MGMEYLTEISNILLSLLPLPAPRAPMLLLVDFRSRVSPPPGASHPLHSMQFQPSLLLSLFVPTPLFPSHVCQLTKLKTQRPVNQCKYVNFTGIR